MQPTDRRGFLRRLGLAALAVSPVGRAAVRTASRPPLSAPEPAPVMFVNGFRNARVGDLRASGGLCTPLIPYYDLPGNIYIQEHPIRDALPSFRV